jgi:hypothetical protein
MFRTLEIKETGRERWRRDSYYWLRYVCICEYK